MAQTYQTSTGRKLAAALVTVVVIAGLVAFADHLKAQPTSALGLKLTAPQATVSTPAPAASTMASASTSPYKDGSYTVDESYFVPSGQEVIQVNLTLASGVVTNAQIRNSEYDGTSAVFQQSFASLYRNQVIGKAISSLELANISGASDTNRAFNTALSQIRSEAQA